MTLLILIFLFLFVLPNFKWCKDDNQDMFNKQYTDSIKGVFLFFVFVRHFLQYGPIYPDTTFNHLGNVLDSLLAQHIVVMFLVYSGYGVMESACRKGVQYVKDIPYHRVFNTWKKFAVAVTLFILVALLLGTHPFSIHRVVLSLIGWEAYGNSNWYIFCILCMYMFSWLSFRIAGTTPKAAWLTLFFSFVYIAALYKFKGSYWWNTALCYPLGMFLSVYKDSIKNVLSSHWLSCMILSVALFVLSYRGISHYSIIWLWLLCTVCFAMVIIVISARIRLYNKHLTFLGGGQFVRPIHLSEASHDYLCKNRHMRTRWLCFLCRFFCSDNLHHTLAQ